MLVLMLRVLWEVGFGGGFARGFGVRRVVLRRRLWDFGGIDFAVSV